MSLIKHNFDSLGDTIVEVMIVLAVLGLALSISYATANHSLLNARQAQENAQATEYGQAQIEDLRALTTTTNPNIFAQSGPFRITNNPATGLQIITDTGPNSPNLSASDPCTQFDPGNLYTVLVFNCDRLTPPGIITLHPTSVTVRPCSGASNGKDTFVVRVQWFDVTSAGARPQSKGIDSVLLAYRTHP